LFILHNNSVTHYFMTHHKLQSYERYLTVLKQLPVVTKVIVQWPFVWLRHHKSYGLFWMVQVNGHMKQSLWIFTILTKHISDEMNAKWIVSWVVTRRKQYVDCRPETDLINSIIESSKLRDHHDWCVICCHLFM